MARASPPLAALSACQPRDSIIDRIAARASSRSSTTSTRIEARSGIWIRARVAATGPLAAASANSRVKENRLPTPISLATARLPPSSDTSRRLIASPSPMPLSSTANSTAVEPESRPRRRIEIETTPRSREFDRIAGQIEQDLAQAKLVAGKGGAQVDVTVPLRVRHQDLDRPAEQGAALIAEGLLDRTVGERDHAALVDDQHAVRRCLDDQPALFLLDRPLGQIAGELGGTEQIARRIEDRGDDDAGPEAAAVLAHAPAFTGKDTRAQRRGWRPHPTPPASSTRRILRARSALRNGLVKRWVPLSRAPSWTTAFLV